MASNPENNPLLSPYGAPFGVILGQDNRVEELNNRITDRTFPDVDFRPNFSPRPVMTKYTLLPIIDQRQTATVKIDPYLDYYPEVMFNPGNARGPISGYLNRVDLETDLRNQNRPLVSGDVVENQYIPSLNSDLYSVTVQKNTGGGVSSQSVEQPHPCLFSTLDYQSSVTNLEGKGVGNDLFNNNTRIQIRGL